MPDSPLSQEPPTGGPVPEQPVGTRMVRGTVAQQGALVVAIVAGLISSTALGRTLTLGEFGVYGFVTTLAAYLYFVAGSVETAAVTAIAGAPDEHEYNVAFTRSLAVLGALGLVAGALIAVGGTALVSVLSFPDSLVHQARLGCLAVGALTAGGWLLKTFQDLQRATQRFKAASLSEAIGHSLTAAAVLAGLAAGAPLWVLIAGGASFTFLVGLAALVMVVIQRVPWRLIPSAASGAGLRGFLSFSGGMFGISASDLVINSMDRTILAALRSASTLGLYEAANRVNTLVRQWSATLSVTLIPVLSRNKVDGGEDVERDLLLRGTKYLLAAAVGPTVALMVLSDRVLAVWLGDRFTDAAPAAATFLALWLVAPNLTVANSLMIVERRLRQLLIYAWGTAAVNLILSVALTAWLGLVGVAIGTTVGYLALMPYFVSFAFAGRGISLRDFARTVWLPVYGLGAALAVLLGLLRLMAPLEHLPEVLAALTVGTLGYWVAFYRLALDEGERRLIRSIIGR